MRILYKDGCEYCVTEVKHVETYGDSELRTDKLTFILRGSDAKTCLEFLLKHDFLDLSSETLYGKG